MNIKIIIMILAALASVSYGEFDDSALWRYYIPPADEGSESFNVNRDGIKSMFLHSNLHGIKSLNWNFISLRYNSGAAGFGMEFSSVGYKEYYRRNKYRARVEYRFRENIRIAPLIEIATEEFGEYGRYTGSSGEIHINYIRNSLAGGIGITDIQFTQPYDGFDKGGFKPFLFGSWIFDEGLILTIGARRFENRRTRWIFDQTISVNRYLVLNFGYMNNPSDIYGGPVLTVNKISFIITYSSISGLDDSVILGISFGE